MLCLGIKDVLYEMSGMLCSFFDCSMYLIFDTTVNVNAQIVYEIHISCVLKMPILLYLVTSVETVAEL